MSHKRILGLWLSLVLLGAEAGGTKELNGVLGESVVFKVKASPSFEAIAWAKIVDNVTRPIALVTIREPCVLLVPVPEYRKRMNISKDCKELHLSQLKKKDAGRYTAVILLPTSEKRNESFDLRVFRCLLDSEMRLTCTPDGAGNENWKLNCSTGTWEDGVRSSWTSDVQSKNPPLGNSMILTSLNLKVTCAAENPVSKAPTTVSLKEACADQTKNFYQLPLWTLLCLSKVGNILLLGCLGLILLVKSRKGSSASDRSQVPPPHKASVISAISVHP